MTLSTVKIAWRNLGRNRNRTLLAMAAIALGQLTLVTVNCMMAGMFDEMLRTITGPLIGHVQIHHGEWREERAVDLFIDKLAQVKSEVARTPAVATISARIYAPVLVASGEKTDEPADAETGMVVGLDVDAETREGGILASLTPSEWPGPGTVVVGKILARKLGITAGQRVAVIGQDADGFPASDLFEVKAVIHSMTDVVNRLGVVMAMTDAGTLLAMPDQAHEIVVQGRDVRDAEKLAAAIAALPALAGMEVLPWREAAPELVTLIDMKDWMDIIFLLILFVAAAAGIANTMTMSAFERRHEFGMLLALGSSPGRIVRMVLVESIILGLAGVAIGSVLGSAIVLITGQTGIDYSAITSVNADDIDFAFKGLNISYVMHPKFEWRHVLFGVVAVTITSIWASVWPAALAARLEPVEAMRS